MRQCDKSDECLITQIRDLRRQAESSELTKPYLSTNVGRLVETEGPRERGFESNWRDVKACAGRQDIEVPLEGRCGGTAELWHCADSVGRSSRMVGLPQPDTCLQVDLERCFWTAETHCQAAIPAADRTVAEVHLKTLLDLDARRLVREGESRGVGKTLSEFVRLAPD